MSQLRTLYRVTIAITEPWAVGTVGGPAEIDLPILLTPTGKPYLPASSLVGSLRPVLDAIDAEWATALLGSDNPKAKQSGRELTALGAQLVSETSVATRASTSVDRWSGAAESRSLRKEQIVPATSDHPTVFEWYIESPSDLDRRLGEALAGWAPVIGRRRTAGRGSAHVAKVQTVTIDFADAAGLTWWFTSRTQWLRGEGDGPLPHEFTCDEPASQDRHQREQVVASDFLVVDPLHVGSGATEGGAWRDVAPIAQLAGQDGPIIPGTSWKGVFRSRAEHIAALLAGGEQAAAEAWQGRVVALFGPVKSANEGGGPRGCLRFTDSVFAGVDLVTRSHVAIDRFTGGARDGALFKVEAIPVGARSCLRVEADRKLSPEEHDLIQWVVRDLDDGLIGVGGLTGRGYGTVKFVGESPVGASKGGAA